MLNYKKEEIKHHNRLPSRPYYILNVIKDKEGTYRSFFGADYCYESSKSDDLLFWEQGMQTTEDFETLYRAPAPYPAGGRDPYVFYDKDIDRYRIISTMYNTNKEWGHGDTMDCALVLSTSDDDSLKSFSLKPRELLRFTDGYKGEPEVSQMNEIADRWYVFASMARRTVHHVGPVSYWMGEEKKGIDDTEFKKELFLTGEDLCAAQVVPVGEKLYLFGWIPAQSRGNQWGGALNLPREVYAMGDGTLATRFDPYLKNILKANRTAVNLGNSAYSVNGSTVLQLTHSGFARKNMEISFTSQNDTFSIVLDKKSGRLQIVAKDGLLYSEIEVQKSDEYHIFAVLDGDIVEVSVNDQTVLCARIDTIFDNYQIQLGNDTTTDGVCYLSY